MSELKGFPIVDGLKLQLNGEDVVIKNGEIFLNNHQESVFHFHLAATGQLGLYEGKLGKFDAFSNPIEEVVEAVTFFDWSTKTVADIKAELTDRGIEFDDKAKKAELLELLK